jgi:hypothetical protein
MRDNSTPAPPNRPTALVCRQVVDHDVPLFRVKAMACRASADPSSSAQRRDAQARSERWGPVAKFLRRLRGDLGGGKLFTHRSGRVADRAEESSGLRSSRRSYARLIAGRLGGSRTTSRQYKSSKGPHRRHTNGRANGVPCGRTRCGRCTFFPRRSVCWRVHFRARVRSY